MKQITKLNYFSYLIYKNILKYVTFFPVHSAANKLSTFLTSHKTIIKICNNINIPRIKLRLSFFLSCVYIRCLVSGTCTFSNKPTVL